ncbi:MAG: MerR family transcriptional regulator [Solirubrobacteraceae bacterium]|nr:MerR family transcriptional regulator [Solirubrobacteraceae bacterium]
MRTLKTSEAASELNVSPNTLRAWERRFGYPSPMRTEGRHRIYTHGEIASLRDALKEGLSISSAISRARENLRADTPVLVGALSACELDRADAAMEAALALRSVERAVEEILLPSLHEIADRSGEASAPWAFAVQWASDWLNRARRLAPSGVRPLTVLVGDATRDEQDPDALDTWALELFAQRAGAEVLTLPVTGLVGLGDVLANFHPRAIVIAGSHASDDDVARWAYAVRAASGPLPVALYRRGSRRPAGRTTGTLVLPHSPSAAQHELMALVEGRPAAPVPAPEPSVERSASIAPVQLRRSASA